MHFSTTSNGLQEVFIPRFRFEIEPTGTNGLLHEKGALGLSEICGMEKRK